MVEKKKDTKEPKALSDKDTEKAQGGYLTYPLTNARISGGGGTSGGSGSSRDDSK